MNHVPSAIAVLPRSEVLAASAEPARTGSGSELQTWAPLVAALLLDVADFFSLGPQGVVMGLLVGTTLGWRIAAASGLSPKWRLASAAAAAVYCMLPFTELLPLATIAATALRARQVLSLVTGR